MNGLEKLFIKKSIEWRIYMKKILSTVITSCAALTFLAFPMSSEAVSTSKTIDSITEGELGSSNIVKRREKENISTIDPGFSYQKNIAPQSTSFVSTWQDFVFAINTPIIQHIELQNDIRLPDEANLLVINRSISIEGKNHHLHLGNQQLNFSSNDNSISDLNMSGDSAVLLAHESNTQNNFFMHNMTISLTDNQTFFEGNATIAYFLGQNKVNGSFSTSTPILSKTHALVTFGTLDTFNISLFDGTNSALTSSTLLIIGNGAELDATISTETTKPFINNAEIQEMGYSAAFKMSSTSQMPVISFNLPLPDGVTAYFNLGIDTNISIHSYGPIAQSSTHYQLYSNGNNNTELLSLSPVLDTAEVSSIILEGTEHAVLENLSGGPVAQSDMHRLSMQPYTNPNEPLTFDMHLRPVGLISTPTSSFENIEYLVTSDMSGELWALSNNSPLENFLLFTGGVPNLSKIQIN